MEAVLCHIVQGSSTLTGKPKELLVSHDKQGWYTLETRILEDLFEKVYYLYALNDRLSAETWIPRPIDAPSLSQADQMVILRAMREEIRDIRAELAVLRGQLGVDYSGLWR